MLVILDGWGLGTIKKADAIQAANTPYMDQFSAEYPSATLTTFGEQVGLPAGQMGNSEVGHLNIGAGRIVFQALARINNSIKDDTLKEEAKIKEAIQYCKDKNRGIHLMGLCSDGGVHSHVEHLKSLIDIFSSHGIQCHLHLFMDGRDTDPKSGVGYIQTVQDHISDKNAEIATIIGRYYAMDRDMRWERIKKAYDLMIKGEGEVISDAVSAMNDQYASGVTDEFMPAMLLDENGLIKEDDAVLFFNFRTDRPRQITMAMTQNDYPDFGLSKMNLHFITMTKYSADFKGLHIVFDNDAIQQTLGEVISTNGKTQVRIAETEKYPHVTFFFNGGKEDPFAGEKRILVASPKVATYDLQPEMSAPEVTTSIIEEIMSNHPDFVCLNYANPDMVGHTGDFDAVVKAVETVDSCLGELSEVALSEGYEIIIIADHGNSDYMVNEDGSPHTAHTTNLVPLIYVSNSKKYSDIKSGKLADIAPTILQIMDIKLPELMTGNALLI